MPDIDFQKIELNLIPKKGDEPVIFYASQYETARPFIADLMWGESEFAPGVDCWAEIDIRKNDDNLVVITDDVSIDNNEVSVILPVQALTCIGKNWGQVKIFAADDHLVCALNFILEVQADPLAGGVTSETAIDNLTEQIEEITQQVIGDDYYNKTEVDDLLADKADQATTYTKSEVDTALNLKADKSTTYTKTQVDSALALKADKSDTYTKTQVDNALALKADQSTTYTKSETDTLLASKANTSDLATVATTGDYDDLTNQPDINAMIEGILDNILPTKTATGTIANFTTALAMKLVSCEVDVSATTITVCGENLFNKSTVTSGYLINGSGNQVSYAGWNISDFIPVPEGASLYLNGVTTHPNTYQDNFMLFDESKTKIGYANVLTSQYPWIVPAGTKYVKFSLNDSDLNTAQLSPTTGTSGEYTTPIIYPVSDKDNVITLRGVNNIFADAGDITLQYKDTTL